MHCFLKLGKHYIYELSGCTNTVISQNDRVKLAFREAAEKCELTVVGDGQFEFAPHGFTYYLLLAESHASIHVWPEHSFCAIDLFTCNLDIDVQPFFSSLRQAFGATSNTFQVFDRGFEVPNAQQTVPLLLHTTEMGLPSNENNWGWHLVLNLYECYEDAIRSASLIKHFVIELCDLIQMRRFREPVIAHFGETPEVAGFSVFQLIETSSISGHFVDHSRAAYLDVFSCKEFDPYKAIDFCAKTFNPRSMRGQFIHRG